MNEYMDSLSNENKKSVKHVKIFDIARFRFGDGSIYCSVDCVEYACTSIMLR